MILWFRSPVKTQPCLVALEITGLKWRCAMALSTTHLPGGLTLAQSSSHQCCSWGKAQPRTDCYWVAQGRAKMEPPLRLLRLGDLVKKDQDFWTPCRLLHRMRSKVNTSYFILGGDTPINTSELTSGSCLFAPTFEKSDLIFLRNSPTHTFLLHCSGPQSLQVNRCPGNVETLGVGGVPKGIISLRQMPTQGLEKKGQN